MSAQCWVFRLVFVVGMAGSALAPAVAEEPRIAAYNRAEAEGVVHLWDCLTRDERALVETVARDLYARAMAVLPAAYDRLGEQDRAGWREAAVRELGMSPDRVLRRAV